MRSDFLQIPPNGKLLLPRKKSLADELFLEGSSCARVPKMWKHNYFPETPTYYLSLSNMDRERERKRREIGFDKSWEGFRKVRVSIIACGLVQATSNHGPCRVGSDSRLGR